MKWLHTKGDLLADTNVLLHVSMMFTGITGRFWTCRAWVLPKQALIKLQYAIYLTQTQYSYSLVDKPGLTKPFNGLQIS